MFRFIRNFRRLKFCFTFFVEEKNVKSFEKKYKFLLYAPV